MGGVCADIEMDHSCNSLHLINAACTDGPHTLYGMKAKVQLNDFALRLQRIMMLVLLLIICHQFSTSLSLCAYIQECLLSRS